jgi:hypothetical protein
MVTPRSSIAARMPTAPRSMPARRLSVTMVRATRYQPAPAPKRAAEAVFPVPAAPR